jgi:hypothetical protein
MATLLFLEILISTYQTARYFSLFPGVVPEREGKMAKDDDQAGRQIGREMSRDGFR